VGSGVTFAVNRSDAVTQGTHFSGAAISGAGGLAKSGAGTLVLTADNLYSGPTTVHAGTLAFAHATSFAQTSEVRLSDQALLQPRTGGISLRAPVTIGAAGTTGKISAPTDLPGAGVVSTFTLEEPIGGAGGVVFTSSAAQNANSTVVLNAPCTYAGPTRLDTQGTAATQIVVRLGVHHALPTGTVLTLDGQVGQGTGRFAELNLNGFNQQLAGLTNIPRTLRFQRVVNSSVSAPATLTLHTTSDHVFSGALGGAANGSVSTLAMPGSAHGNHFGLTKSGPGTFTVAGAHTYGGDATVGQGVLALTSPNPNQQEATLAVARTGATMRLDFSGTQAVRNLSIGGIAMPPGVYQAAGNPPPDGIPLSALDGVGTLAVTAGPAGGYAVWQIINGTDQSPAEDHDGDGVMNGIEFFHGGPLARADGFTPRASVAQTAGQWTVTWSQAPDYPGLYGADFRVETAPAPNGPWLGVDPGPVLSLAPGQVRYTVPPAATRLYVRLRVNGPG
jgi:autotransporter-associated beta strand protein